ncbi:NUDIX domain-containing protein [Novosphingobium sp. BL-8H]|uniref:NUDIX domain-containing protein n=1 Tax=Novosphingobium sp. BL-8H TaxID=3127640 RepID=UPI003757629A
MSADTISILNSRVLSDDWGKLTKYDFDLLRRDGNRQRQAREVYDRGNGATCLLHDPVNDTVLLTRQFRLPVYLNGGAAALVETPAGLLDGAEAAERMRAELIEETGYRIDRLTHLYDLYMSPGSVTEYLAFFVGTYSASDRMGQGGGKIEEGEDIEVLHVPFDDALHMIGRGEICDAKTVVLLQHLALTRAPKPAQE